MNKRLALIVFGLMLGIFSLFNKMDKVEAGVCDPGECWGVLTAHQYVCSATANNPDACLDWSDPYGRCSNMPGSTCTLAGSGQCYDVHTGDTGTCYRYCKEYGDGAGDNCVADNVSLGCTESASYCRADAKITNCTIQSTDGLCVETTAASYLGCCGGDTGDHLACVSNSCQSVSGSGADSCSDDADCEPPEDPDTHYECVGLSCQVVDGDGANTCSTNADCNPSYTVSGTVFLDNTGGRDKSNPIESGSGAQVSIPGEVVADVGNDGTYSISNVDTGTKVVTLSGMDVEYQCSDPVSCQRSKNVNQDRIANFWMSQQRGAWWQTSGGDVGANNGNLSSNIPASCIPGICYPFMTRGTADASGVLYLSGTIGFGNGGSASEGTNFIAQSTMRTTTRREGYEYFFRLFEMGLSPVDDFPVKTGVDKPTTSSANGRAYFSNGSLTLNNSDWVMNPGDSMVIFVDGSLNIEQNITTPVGTFLAFVVSGDITFEVGTATVTSEAAQVEGVFIADGMIQTNSGTDKFVGEGIFVGWSGVVLSRDFDSDDNNTNPAEYFIYRPDFVVNAPARMKRPVIRWEEVAP